MSVLDKEDFLEEVVELEIDPGRLVFGLSRIGYTPAAAISDIIDNSVTANANKVTVLIIKEDPNIRNTKENNVKEYIVIDDGNGMNEKQIKEALKLGSTDEHYDPETLSKFGLGLKSAAFSQGNELQIISSPGGGEPFIKFVLSLSDIGVRYYAKKVVLSQNDIELISQHLPSRKGTIVRISDVKKSNHPSVKNTLDELVDKLGVVYYYFLKEGLEIEILHDEKIRIAPVDVLYVEEADTNGKLNEYEWDGKKVKWIERPTKITLDSDNKVEGIIEVTQLPYPPLFELDERGGAAKARENYRIEAGNYGYYVYRNKRLIAWAEGFKTKNGTIIPQDQSYYAFRGRILIDDSADDAFNIDVKKSSIVLSNEAWLALDDISLEYKSKSKKAWGRAKQLAKEKRGQDPNLTANSIVKEFEPPQSLPGESLTPKDEVERKENEEQVNFEMREKMRKRAASKKSEEEGRTVSVEEINEEEIDQVLRENANPSATKIFRVQTIEDNILWEPYYDTDHGTCVRINKGHRFAKLLFEENSSNVDLQVLLELYLLQMAEAEIYALKVDAQSRTQVSRTLNEYRRYASEFLAAMCRTLEGKLPPLKDDLGL